MEQRGMHNDSRYQQLMALAQQQGISTTQPGGPQQPNMPPSSQPSGYHGAMQGQGGWHNVPPSQMQGAQHPTSGQMMGAAGGQPPHPMMPQQHPMMRGPQSSSGLQGNHMPYPGPPRMSTAPGHMQQSYQSGPAAGQHMMMQSQQTPHMMPGSQYGMMPPQQGSHPSPLHPNQGASSTQQPQPASAGTQSTLMPPGGAASNQTPPYQQPMSSGSVPQQQQQQQQGMYSQPQQSFPPGHPMGGGPPLPNQQAPGTWANYNTVYNIYCVIVSIYNTVYNIYCVIVSIYNTHILCNSKYI